MFVINMLIFQDFSALRLSVPSTEHHEVKLDETQAQLDDCGGEFGVARLDGSFLTNKYCINKYTLRETNMT